MSIILKGIDMHPKFVRTYRIYPNGDVVELANDGMRKSDEVYEAIQIPKGHGDLIDRNQVFTYSHRDVKNLEEVPVILEEEK